MLVPVVETVNGSEKVQDAARTKFKLDGLHLQTAIVSERGRFTGQHLAQPHCAHDRASRASKPICNCRRRSPINDDPLRQTIPRYHAYRDKSVALQFFIRGLWSNLD